MKAKCKLIVKIIFGILISLTGLCLVSQVLFGFILKPSTSDTFEFNQEFTKNQLTKDTDLLFDKIESIHPGITSERAKRFANNDFDFVSDEEFMQIRSSVMEKINHKMTGREYLKLLLPSITLLNDEHTELDFFDYKDIQNQEFFPLNIEVDFKNAEFIVQADYQNVKKGSILDEINGVPVSEVIQNITNYFSGVSIAQKQNYVSQYYKEALYIYFGNVDYEIVLNDGTSIGIEPASYRSKKETPYSYEIKDHTAIFTYHSFIGPEKEFKAFLKDMFSEIKEKDVSKLIIDLSDNRGGDSYYGDMILYYLTDQEFSQLSISEVKASKESKEFFLSYVPAFLRWSFPQYYIPPISKLFSIENGELVKINLKKTRKSLDNRFVGEVEVVINQGTMSSASLLAATIETYHLGKITGVVGGGYASHFGNQLRLYMDNTGIPVYIPCSYNYGNSSGALLSDPQE